MIKIGIIDSGINAEQLSLIRNISSIDGLYLKRLGDTDLIDRDSNFSDENGHGNECFRIISSIITNVNYYIVKIFGKQLETELDILVAAIETCITERVDIINISAGIRLDKTPEKLRNVCYKAYLNGIIILAAQHYQGKVSYPAQFPYVISVGTGDLSNGEYFRFFDMDEGPVFLTSAADLFPEDSDWSKSTSFSCAKMTGYIGNLFNERGKMNFEKLIGELITLN
ncbi:MAG: hypothetical protein K0S24_1902 [Sphingobacterium sp.]|jgi:hypothetical protein|nr:hypothetical protein [Sphingobacterium sp.]